MFYTLQPFFCPSVTNTSNGKAVEHLHYMPWDEDFVRQRNTGWHARYTFSAKGKDAETGYSYFDARYYSSDLGIWLSVDPMSDKYPSLSPYAYCADNPVKLADPNGMDVTNFKDDQGNLIKHVDDGSNAVFTQKGSSRHKYYDFTGYDESQGGTDVVNLETAIQEQQQLNFHNPSLQEDENGTTYCNFATQNVMKTVSSTPGGKNALVTGRANDMINTMEKDNPNYILVSQDQAEKYATDGGLAIVGYRSKQGSGHVATFAVGKKTICKDIIANIGPAAYTGSKSLNATISKSKEKFFFIFISGNVGANVNIKPN